MRRTANDRSTSPGFISRRSLVLRFAIMMTYSCRRPRGSTTEFGEQRGEIAAREGPLERLRRVDVVFLEAKKPLTDRAERTEVIRREDLALDDGEIDLNLIEPAGWGCGRARASATWPAARAPARWPR